MKIKTHRSFEAKYRGQCARCSEPIAPGQQVQYIGEKALAHLVCPKAPVSSRPKPAPNPAPNMDGKATRRYEVPCPKCGFPLLPGHVVTEVKLPDGNTWWHRVCRRKFVRALLDGGDD